MVPPEGISEWKPWPSVGWLCHPRMQKMTTRREGARTRESCMSREGSREEQRGVERSKEWRGAADLGLMASNAAPRR